MFKKAVWIFLPAMLVAGQTVSQELYRYIDGDGITILNSTIPAEYVNAGYEIINGQGQVIQIVPPAKPSEPELVVEKADTILMSSYSDVVEIEDHRDRKIQSIEREIQNIQTDQRVLGMQLDKEIAERDRIAARIESMENPSERLVERLDELSEHIEQIQATAGKLEALMLTRSSDMNNIRTEYALKVERFLLLEQGELDVRHTSIESSE